MATKRQRRKRRRRLDGASAGSGEPIASGTGSEAGSGTPAQPAGGSQSASAVGAGGARKRSDGPPPAPWGSFPLSELVVVVAIVFLIAGFIVSPPRGAVMIGAGLALGSLAGLELAVREHFAGYRSHTLLLAGAIGVAVVAGLYLSGAVVAGVALLAGIAVFGGFGWLFASAFRRRSGGALFRFKGGR
jgi:hypothetical protein